MSEPRHEEERSQTLARVSVSLSADALRPEEVSRLVGLEPSWSYAKGDPSPKTKTPRPWGLWGLEVEDEDVEPAARRLLAMLAGKREKLEDAATRFGAKVTVAIWWQPEGGQGGYTLPSSIVLELASLGAR